MCHPLRRQHCGPVLSCSLFFTGRPVRSAAMPVLFLLSSRKQVFRPAGATRCPDKREIWHRGADRRLSGQKCGNTTSKTVKISNFDHKFAPQASLVCTILRNSQIL